MRKKGIEYISWSPFSLPSKVSPRPCAGSAGLGCYVLVTKNLCVDVNETSTLGEVS